ncbi:MAG: lysostaphin resistance A-like protein [Rhodanobacteraceae bacterium]
MPTIPSTSQRIKAVFRGADGLHIGWSALLFLTIFAAVLVVIGMVVAFMPHHPHHHPPMRLAMTRGRMIFTEFAQAFAVLAATVVMGRVERKSWLDYSWRGPRRATRLIQGVLAGLILMSLLMCALVLTHGATIRYSGGGWSLLISGATLALGFALVALFEESMFRGYLFFRLANGSGPYLAAIIMSLVFGVTHLGNHGEDVLGILQVVVFGLVMCLAVWRTGSLWWALGFHAAWDWSESFLFGAADSGNIVKGHLLTTHAAGPAWLSGGSVGPEGSLMVLPLLALMAIWIVLTVSGKPRTKTAVDAHNVDAY